MTGDAERRGPWLWVPFWIFSKLKVTNSLGWSEGSSRNGETRGTTQPAQTARPQDEEDEEEETRSRGGKDIKHKTSRGGREERGDK